MSREMRGQGNVYLRGATWWIQYSHRGKVYRESSESSEQKVARKLLKKRNAETSRGRIIGPVAEKITLGDMRDALLVDYRLCGNRSIWTAGHYARNLIGYFGENARALDITSDRIAAYIEARREQGYANATVNREVECLRHMFYIMVKAGRLSRNNMPATPHLQEAPARRGFLEPADFARLRAALPAHLREPASFLYLTGWRKGAMCRLQWLRDCELKFDDENDLVGGSVTLQAEQSKNKQAYTLPLKGELLEVIRRAWASRIPECPFVFHDGARAIRDFRKSWMSASKTAGLDGILVHDMRRSCARNLIRAGVAERVAMNVTGHKTRSMFDRYNIVAESDLESAIERVSGYITEREAEPTRPKVVPLVRKAG
jgi:integrase